MKKYISLFLLLFLFASCSNSKPVQTETVVTMTKDSFMAEFSKLINNNDTIIPITTIDDAENNQSISTFVLNSKYSEKDSHVSVAVSKNANMIKSISIFAEWDCLLKADGSKEIRSNIGLEHFVNLIAMAVDKNIDIGKFITKYELVAIETTGILIDESKFTCHASNTSDEYESFYFILK